MTPCLTDCVLFQSCPARWITNSYEADIFLVFATVDPSLGYKGITCFVVEKGMGVKVAKKEEKVSFSLIRLCSFGCVIADSRLG